MKTLNQSVVIPFPNRKGEQLRNAEISEWAAQRQGLAVWLRLLADLVESNSVAVEPIAATVILSGHAGDEVLHMGYQENHKYFNNAAAAMSKVASLSPEMRAIESEHPRIDN